MDVLTLWFWFMGRSGNATIQERWVQLLDMARIEGALCGARPGPSNCFNSWLWGICISLEVYVNFGLVYRKVTVSVSVYNINNLVSKTVTLLNDADPHNMTVGCWEFSLNLSLFVQLFEHLVVIMVSHDRLLIQEHEGYGLDNHREESGCLVHN